MTPADDDPSGNVTESEASARKRRRLGFVIAPFGIFIALALFFALALSSGDPSKIPSALIDKPVPDVSFAELEGLSGDARSGFTPANLKTGRVSVVNFWASWCAPCIQEHPHLVELTKQTDAQLYGVNYKDKPQAAQRFLGRYGNPYAAVGTDVTGRNAIEWGVYGMPETFVVNGEGRITYKHVGPISAESLRDELLPAIERAKAGTASSS